MSEITRIVMFVAAVCVISYKTDGQKKNIYETYKVFGTEGFRMQDFTNGDVFKLSCSSFVRRKHFNSFRCHKGFPKKACAELLSSNR